MKLRLHNAVVAYMNSRKLSLRTLAKQLGMAPSTLSRVLRGKNVESSHILPVVQWLMEPDDETQA